MLVRVNKAVNPSLFHMLYSWTRRMTHEPITIRIIGFLTQLSKIRVIYLALSITQEWKHFCQSRRRAGIVCGVMLLHALIIRSCKLHIFSVMLYCVYLISLCLQTDTAHVSVRLLYPRVIRSNLGRAAVCSYWRISQFFFCVFLNNAPADTIMTK